MRDDGKRFAMPQHPYKVEAFDHLPPVIFGPDGRCACTVTDHCPLRRTGDQPRCTRAELEQCDWQATLRIGSQS